MANLVLKNNTSGGKTSVTADNFVGNASTASKWLTARTITLAGDATGSVSIDGSGNKTLTVTVADNSHNHTTLSSVTALNFATHSDDGASITTTIDSTTSYLDFNMLDDAGTDSFRWRFNRWDSTTSAATGYYNLMTLTSDNNNKAVLTVNGTINGSLAWSNVTGKPSTFTPSSHTHDYLPLSGGTMTGSPVIKFPASAGSIATSDPMSITYGRISAYGTLCINANTDNSGTEYVILTAGKGHSSSTADGLAVGTSTLTWQGSNVLTASNYSSYISGITQWAVTSTNPSTTSTDSNLTTYNVSNSRLYWVTQTGVVANQPSQWGYIMDIGQGQERHQIWMTQPHSDLWHRGGNGSGWGGAWKKILDSSNWSSYCAPASHSHSYLPLSGGNLTGLLTISLNGNTTTIGSQNSSWCHIYNSADARFIFNKDVVTIGAFAIYQCDSKGCGSSFPGSPILGQIFYKI